VHQISVYYEKQIENMICGNDGDDTLNSQTNDWLDHQTQTCELVEKIIVDNSYSSKILL
jgi:hypothetical protein